ncbi:unnamed protein product [Moneuplotes crassus]|uniref:Uncharacterized protein n=1 Tax=Euplotes crassus TaxID=5936 RepID=A0AAD1XU50_EUPCR|nr:unnamed protein product [Moneuplotes crassus]
MEKDAKTRKNFAFVTPTSYSGLISASLFSLPSYNVEPKEETKEEPYDQEFEDEELPPELLDKSCKLASSVLITIKFNTKQKALKKLMVPEYAMFYKESKHQESLDKIESIFKAKRACALDYNLWEEVQYNKDIDMDDLDSILTDQDHENSYLHFYDPHDQPQHDKDPISNEFGDDSEGTFPENIDEGIEHEYEHEHEHNPEYNPEYYNKSSHDQPPSQTSLSSK